MSDYISRADAIEACCRGWNNTAEDCIRNIKALPSAELPNSELISRADAIGIIEDYIGKDYMTPMSRLYSVRSELSALPSAELPKGDLISRADVLKYPIRLDHYDEENGSREFVYGVESVIEYVESLPSADAEPKWNCTANFVAEQLDRLRNMTDEERWDFFIKFFSPSADAVSREEYEETDGVVAIEKKNANEVGEIKHIVIRSPNYTRYFYNESMPLPSADAVHGEWNTGKPTKCGKYIVTLIGIGNYRFVDIMHYDKPCMPNREVSGECWYRDDDEWGDVVYDDKDIIAWIPLPTPYKGGDDE